jgi:hypothetical protein
VTTGVGFMQNGVGQIIRFWIGNVVKTDDVQWLQFIDIVVYHGFGNAGSGECSCAEQTVAEELLSVHVL